MHLGPDPHVSSGGSIIQDYHNGNLKVGILGAGIAGLYAALILDSLGIQCEILEASNRTGGRISTYRFPGGGKYDYYDTGAMRFPLPPKDSQGHYKNGVMRRLTELIEYGPLNEGQDCLKDKLLPYYFYGQEGSKPGGYYLNGTHEHPFRAEEMDIHAGYIRVGARAIYNDVTGRFARLLVNDMETGMKTGLEILMANDSHTLRSYLATKYLPSAHLEIPPQHLPDSVINWCELFRINVELPLSRTVFSSMVLPYTDPGDSNAQWRCFEGGYEVLPKKIEEYLNRKGDSIRFGKRVTAISQSHMAVETQSSVVCLDLPVVAEELQNDWIYLAVGQDKIADDATLPGKSGKTSSVAVTVNGNETRNYSHVISTLPLSILRVIDLRGAGLNVKQRNALQEVEYSNLIKIGIFFKSNWWTTKLGIVGGQLSTDLPISTIVYPSHGVDSRTPSKVLIAAYTIKRGDADQLGTLAMSGREALKELVLRNLAEAHNGLHPEVTYDYLNDQFVDMHVKDWAREEYAMGATSGYKPGALRDSYPSLTLPAAEGHLHFAGEAVSYHQGWVIGALQSAWRAVYGYLEVTGQEEKMNEFKALWGENPEWAEARIPNGLTSPASRKLVETTKGPVCRMGTWADCHSG